MKTNAEQEILNLKATIDEKEKNISKKLQVLLMRKHLYNSSVVKYLQPQEVQAYD